MHESRRGLLKILLCMHQGNAVYLCLIIKYSDDMCIYIFV